MFQIVVADGLTYDDHNTVGFTHTFQREYMKIQESFNRGECVLIMFKHLSATSKYDRSLKTEAYTCNYYSCG